MTTPLYPAFEKRIDDSVDRILKNQIDPWVFFNTGYPLNLTGFDGRTIAYQGIEFEGSPRDVYWVRYIEPFLEELAVQQIALAVEEARNRKVDGRQLLLEIQGLLFSGCAKIFNRMAQIDQCLLGKGFPQSVPLRPIDQEYELMQNFIEKHICAELEMWKPDRRFETWYEHNKFLTWAIGILIGAAGLAVKYL